MSHKLKPCPFCGDVPTLKSFIANGRKMRYVACVNNDCTANPAGDGTPDNSCILEWNRRADGETITKLRSDIEELEDALADEAGISSSLGLLVDIHIRENETLRRALIEAKQALSFYACSDDPFGVEADIALKVVQDALAETEGGK